MRSGTLVIGDHAVRVVIFATTNLEAVTGQAVVSTGWGGDKRGQEPRSPLTGEAPAASLLLRKVVNFAIERQRHARFVGRVALLALAQLDQQLINATSPRWVVVTGGPGMGKSALLAAWLARREAAGDIVPHHLLVPRLAVPVARRWCSIASFVAARTNRITLKSTTVCQHHPYDAR